MCKAACGIFFPEKVFVKLLYEEVECILQLPCIIIELQGNLDQAFAESDPDTKLLIEASILNQIYVFSIKTFFLVSFEFVEELYLFFDGFRESFQGVLNDYFAVGITIERIINCFIISLFQKSSMQKVKRMSCQFSQVSIVQLRSLLGEIVLDKSTPECSRFELLLKLLLSKQLEIELEELALDLIKTIWVS